ncbi:class I SAM-dependent methyltransferase [Streptomyces sp. NPDC006984]|uniref:class I SAM-dependent methyltransferase n=1 Tax=Streptomyces sp. NPDC006984 TaxID=3155463 RepID=UPI0033C35338
MTTDSAGPAVTTWDAWADAGQTYHPLTDVELAAFARNFPVRCGHVAVDAGCGTGPFARQLHRFGYDVTGIDFSESALTAARRTPMVGVRYMRHDLNEGDPAGLPLHGIDLVVSRLTLPFLTNPGAWMCRVRERWLRRGGRMYVVVPVVTARGRQPGGMTEREISNLTRGWAQAVRYELRGSLVCLALRTTAT